MSIVRKLFPFSFRAYDLKSLITTIISYVIADFVCGVAIGLLGIIPFIGFLLSLIGWGVSIYFFAGIVVAVLYFLGALKE